MLLTATLLGLIAALGILDGRLLGVSMIDRPLVMCALTGLVCGNLHEGILIGATLELIFLGNVAIGAAHPPFPAPGVETGLPHPAPDTDLLAQPLPVPATPNARAALRLRGEPAPPVGPRLRRTRRDIAGVPRRAPA
ncbi:PTS sugar transporter subunit IIC, partial [Pseudomonas aeruginosa]|uniref:PTS sugar transporter subunit IIC n=1 Tax=Pseudomonas aeruginosa TaxID=287 RepID=UPI001926131A